MRVLVVEDDAQIGDGLKIGLEQLGFVADWFRDGKQGLAALSAAPYDAVVLDLGLPGMDGMDILSAWRRGGQDVPVLVLTARDAVEDRVAGLRAGADDYLLKPFDLDELVARLHALRRRAAGRCVDVIEDGPLRLDPMRGEVWLHGRPVALARRELALLAALMQARERILSAEQLKDRLYDYSEEIESNALNVHIHHLRRKLGPAVVETVRGLGYRYGRAGE